MCNLPPLIRHISSSKLAKIIKKAMSGCCDREKVHADILITFECEQEIVIP